MKSSISCFGWTPYIEISVAMGQIEEEVKKSRTPRTPHLKEKCKSFISRIGKGGRKQYNSSDFSYDTLSYALNFEDETHLAEELQNNIINFTSRLPPTPDRAPVIKPFQPKPGELVCMTLGSLDFNVSRPPLDGDGFPLLFGVLSPLLSQSGWQLRCLRISLDRR
ncbi:hypothetical protein Godav_008033 [Gossypium davidsonii]|uniref:Uncharacterized protein n=1 Tax=Gossypium davidsonii TaxID=34287 RepID=A0A7J8S8R1_GOSDV|nr:hypothetical protein [Gossypium davidsonii]